MVSKLEPINPRLEATDIGNEFSIFEADYNAGGIRTAKTVNGVTTTYHLVGDN